MQLEKQPQLALKRKESFHVSFNFGHRRSWWNPRVDRTPGRKSIAKQGIPVRALVHKIDSRSDELRKDGAEVVEGDLLNPASVQAALRNIKRAYFTYPVADGLLEAATLFAEKMAAARS